LPAHPQVRFVTDEGDADRCASRRRWTEHLPGQARWD
jgi:hypothetical protein